MPEKAVLSLGDQQIELPVLVGTEGEKAVDITRLRDTLGLITYDPSLSSWRRNPISSRRPGC